MRYRHVITAATVLIVTASTGVRASTDAVAVPGLAVATTRVAVVARTAGLAGEIVLTDQGGAISDTVFGLADREKHKSHVRSERWLWASVTKQITATLVMQEVERGVLALDVPIGQHLPAFGGDRTITIRQLLQHRSGLPNPSDGVAGDDVQPFHRETGPGISDAARTRGFCGGPSQRAKCGDFDYNNCDYLVLGALLEQVTGKPFARLVAVRISQPLGLRTLRMALDGAASGRAAAIGYDGMRRYPALNVTTFGAAGALRGSAADLAAIDRALIDGRLLSASARAVAWAGDPKLGYEALGVWSFPARLPGCAASIDLVERRGDVAGTQVRNILAPRLGRAVIVFVNDARIDFGEVWQGKGLTYDLLAAAFCTPTEK